MKDIFKKILLSSLLLFLVVGCGSKKEEEKEYKEVLSASGNTSVGLKEYAKTSDDKVIYTSYEEIKYDGKDLSEAVKNEDFEIKSLVNKMELGGELNDGGSRYYNDGSVVVTVCNSDADHGNNHNIYITGESTLGTKMCSYNESAINKCFKDTLNSYIVSSKVKAKNGKLESISKITKYEKITYKKSSLGEYIIIKTENADLISAIKKYFKKQNKKYYYNKYSVYNGETTHVFFYDKKSHNPSTKIDNCLSVFKETTNK